MNKKYHYVYLILELSTNMRYIGVRSCTIRPEDDIGHKYFSSSKDKRFMLRQKHNPYDYIYIVLSTFKTREEANTEEIRLHELHKVSLNEMFYNKSNSTSKKFSVLGYVYVVDINGIHYFVRKDDPRYLSGELTYAKKKRVYINGIIYDSISHAKTELSMCNKTIKKNCEDSNCENFKYVKY